MRKGISHGSGRTLSLALLLVAATVCDVYADVRVNVNLGPPPIVVAEPPEVVLVPGSSVYFVPGYDFDIFFYNGYWWSPRGERWYRSRAYDGPWRVVSRQYVPRPVYSVPHNYRRVYVHERRIPYGQWKRQGRHGGGEYKGHGGYGEHQGHGAKGHDGHQGHGGNGHDGKGHGGHKGH